jgi:hypothetical protein
LRTTVAVDARPEVAVQRHPRRGGDAFGPAQVLDGDRHAVQLRQDLALADHLLGGARLGERELGGDERVRLQARVEALDPAQHRLGELDGGDLACGDEARQLVDLEIVEVVGGHDRFLRETRRTAKRRRYRLTRSIRRQSPVEPTLGSAPGSSVPTNLARFSKLTDARANVCL